MMPSLAIDDSQLVVNLSSCRTSALTITSAFCYHGSISRAESERRLKDFSQTSNGRFKDGGLYLVRQSSKRAEDYVLSYMGNKGAMSHFIITKTANNR